MGKAGTSGGIEIHTERLSGKLKYPEKDAVDLKGVAETDGIAFLTIANTTQNAQVDKHGSSYAAIKVNGVCVSETSVGYPASGEVRTFGASTAAAVQVKKGDEIWLRSLNTAYNATYTATILHTCGNMKFTEA